MHSLQHTPQQEVVLVVDDDPSMLAAIRRLLISAKFEVEIFEGGANLLADAKFDRPGCLILDVLMPGMTGLEVQAALKQRQVRLPIIFLTGLAEVPIAVEAMRQGAVDFVEKPFDNSDLLLRVRRAIDGNHQRRQEALARNEISLLLTSLTARENEVLQLVVAGKTSKEIARALGSSHRTVEIHRGHLMKKMAASTVADLVRMCMAAQEEVHRGFGVQQADR
ncbi:MAG: response regulator [Dokdonella sp.]